VSFTTIFFDLDDTLYPASSGLWTTLKQRMTHYMVERMKIPEADVPRLRESYFRTYGTTLRGLQANHVIDTEEYLAYVHDVRPGEYIRPDPIQQSVLAALPTRNLIFTNADANHARRVLRALQIEAFRGHHRRPTHGAVLQAKPRGLCAGPKASGEDDPASA
jgi:pyrimidine 5'-nucleotidase